MSTISDISDYLEDQALGTVGTDIFDTYLPDAVVPSMAVIDTGGQAPDIYLPVDEPTFQVYIRALTYAAGFAKLEQVKDALHNIYNQTIGSTNFMYIQALSNGGSIGQSRDAEGRGFFEFSINFKARIRKV